MYVCVCVRQRDSKFTEQSHLLRNVGRCMRPEAVNINLGWCCFYVIMDFFKKIYIHSIPCGRQISLQIFDLLGSAFS